MNELLCLHRSERYGTCDDEAEAEGRMMPVVLAHHISRPRRKIRRCRIPPRRAHGTLQPFGMKVS